MLRFSVGFLWISVSKRTTVSFSLCLEQKSLRASPSHPGNCPNTGLQKMIHKAFLQGPSFPLHSRESTLTCSFTQIIGLKYYVRL